jgi:hypothetical protein
MATVRDSNRWSVIRLTSTTGYNYQTWVLTSLITETKALTLMRDQTGMNMIVGGILKDPNTNMFLASIVQIDNVGIVTYAQYVYSTGSADPY